MADKKHYLNAREFLDEVCKYKVRLKECADAGLTKPQMGNKLGLDFQKIAENYSNHPWFRNYPLPIKQDMISDAIFHCIKYVDSFDPEKSKNAFAYFSQITYHSFRQRVEKERKYLGTKYKLRRRAQIFNETSDRQPHDIGTDYGDSTGYSDEAIERQDEFIDKLDKSLAEKKKKQLLQKKKKLKS